MKFGTLLKKRKNRDFFLKLYFIFGMLFIVLIFIIYTNFLMKNVKKDIQLVPDLYAKFISLPDDVNLEEFLLQYFMSKIVPNINYPVIIADSLNVPFSWENVEIDKVNFYLLDKKEQNKLVKMMKKMKKKNAIIPLIKEVGDPIPFSYLYYGESLSMKQLRFIPYLEMVILSIFIIFGIYGILIIKKHEQDTLWIGLAKETAHQFGTPISSLLGWIEILALKMDEINADDEITFMLNYMKADITRLNKIADRFGKVGSQINLKSQKIDPILEDIVKYFKKRLPSFDTKIDIMYEKMDDNRKVKIDESLLRWAIENIVKNSIDAMKSRSGKVTVKTFSDKKNLHILFSDQGVGLPKSMFRKIFQPGITSKKRGWGLGLSLAKRIVEEFHNGRIFVQKSEVNVGTSIEIILPLEK